MSRLEWDKSGERFYETGVDRCVLYPSSGGSYEPGVAWNGITAINDSPSGAEASPLYADNIKYLNLISAEDLGLSIEAYTYPDEFAVCDGSAEVATGVMIRQQNRKHFGICYRTLLGNDEDGTDYGYKIHIVYDCVAAPSEKGHSTVNDSPEAITMSWEVSTTPVNAGEGNKPSAGIDIDSTKIPAEKLTALENLLYGTENADPTLPSIPAIVALVTGATGATGATGTTGN